MGHLACLALAVFLTVSPSVDGEVDEPLNPVFADESFRDPFLTPAKSQISGPLDGESPNEDWDLQHQINSYSPFFGDAFESDAEESCVDTGPVSAPRRSPIIDSGITATYLAPVGGFGVSDVDARTSLVFPVFVKGSPLRLSMSAGTTFIDASETPSLPTRLYGIQAELRWYIPLKETWGIDLGAGGGVYSDLNGTAGQGFRVTGRAILVKEINPRLKVSGGVLYLGRKNLLAMPIAGLIYTPSDDVRLELLIPRPRLLKRVALNGTREHWVYAGGEIFGGNTWAVQQANGAQDTFIYKDNRVLVGYETKSPGGIAGRIEAGYVFMRHVSFTTDPTTLDPAGTLLMRVGLTY